MQPDHLSSEDLRLVLAVAEGRGLARAAERLSINASTVFRRLGQLEERLGLKLFERHRAGYDPTEAGHEVAAVASRLEGEMAALSLRLAGQAALPDGEIRLTTNDALLVSLLTPLFAGFRQLHPGIRLDVVLSNEALNLSRRDADIAIRVTSQPPETLVGRRVATVGWALYGREGDLEDDLSDRDWVALGEPLDGVAAARYVQRRVPAERIAYRVNTVLALTEAVEAGLGIGPLPCFVADRRPGLRRLAPPDPDLAGSLWLLTHPDLRHVPRVRALLDHLAGAIARQRAALAGEAP